MDITTKMLNAKWVKVHVLIFHIKFAVPKRRHLQAFVDRENTVPVEIGVGLVAIQFEMFRLVKSLWIG